MEEQRTPTLSKFPLPRKTHDTSPAFDVEYLPLPLDFQSNDISTPMLPSIPVFEGIGFLESSKSSALPKNMEPRVSICFPLFHSSRDPKRAGVIKGEAALLEADFHRLIYFSA